VAATAPPPSARDHGATHPVPTMTVDPYVKFIESFFPGIGLPTEQHDVLHRTFGLDQSVRSEAWITGFQLGQAGGSHLQLRLFQLISFLLYPPDYRNTVESLPIVAAGFRCGRSHRGLAYDDLRLQAVRVRIQ
jgi:hypothetical protein